MVQAGTNYSNDELEKRWQENLEKEAYFHGPPQVFDEEVIRCWEGCLSNLKETGSGAGSEEEDKNSDDNKEDSGGEDGRDGEE